MTLHPSYPISGCDISAYQGSIDFDKLVDAGIWFVIARAAIGKYPDTRYPAYKSLINYYRLPLGAYHVWSPLISSIDNAKTLILAQPDKLPMRIWLDCEVQTTLSRMQSSQHILDTLEEIDEHYQTFTGLYFNQESWQRLIDPSYYDKFELDNRPLWVANYIDTLADSTPNLPVGWPRWDVWQFSAEYGPYGGHGSEFGVSSASLDIDAFYGNLAQFNIFIDNMQPPPPPPEEPPMQIKTKVVCNIRNNPDLTAGSDVGNLEAGKVLNVITKVGGFYKVEAYVSESVADPVIDPPIPPTVPEYYVAHDLLEVVMPSGKILPSKGAVRPAAPNPEVYWLSETKVILTEAWQRLIYDMNQPNMTKKAFRQNLAYNVAWCNDTGFNEVGDPRRDYINGLNLSAKYPNLDKCRVCGGATIRGTESNGILTVEVLDGSKPPPSWEWLKARPWLYFRAYIVNTDGSVFDFPYCGPGNQVIMPLVGIPPVTVKLNFNDTDRPAIPYIKRI